MTSFAALTICNPYPFLILQRADATIPEWMRQTFGPPGKRCENRRWYCGYQGWLLIHAGKSSSHLGGIPRKEFAALMPFMAIVGRAFMYDCVRIRRDDFGKKLVPHSSHAIPKKFYPELVNDPHAEGEYCFLLKDIERIDQPVPMQGKLGFWRVPAAALEGRTFARVDA